MPRPNHCAPLRPGPKWRAASLFLTVLACGRGHADSAGDSPGPTGFESETCAPVVQYDAPDTLGTADAGLEYCWNDDPFHPRWARTSAPACTGDGAAFVPECDATNPGATCSTDADCGTDQCTNDAYGTSCVCQHVCDSDDDCASGESCLCASGYVTPGGSVLSPSASTAFAPACLPSECRSDADCAGEPCGLYIDMCQNAGGFACHTRADTCRWDSDCSGANICSFDGTRWGCLELASCE